jgi:ABC-type spermidine/putrescine transport system permease subunit II
MQSSHTISLIQAISIASSLIVPLLILSSILIHAGHMVPQYQPGFSLDMYRKFLNNEKF